MQGNNTTLQQSLSDWMQQNNLTLYDFLSITFTPRFTYDDIVRNGKRAIPALYRFHMLTQLDTVKLTDEEMAKYKLDSREQTQNDEKIAERFIQEWRADGKIPQGDERLSHSDRNNPDKKKLTKLLLERYHGKRINPKDTSPPPQREQSSERGPSISFTPVSFISYAADELEEQLSQSSEEIQRYKKSKATRLKRLKVLLDIYFKEDPKKAYEEMLKSKDLIF